jgi:hypothetical protein
MPLPLRIIPEIITGSLTTEFILLSRHSVEGRFMYGTFKPASAASVPLLIAYPVMASEDTTFFQRAAIPAFETPLGKNAMGGEITNK